MESEYNCPICGIQFGVGDNREYMLCMSQHFVCYYCVKQITRKDSTCPFCRKMFKYSEVQPRRIPKKEKNVSYNEQGGISIKQGNKWCPLGHRRGQFFIDESQCNNCGTIRSGYCKCSTCKYVNCRQCKKLPHENLCRQGQWTYDQKRMGCNICSATNEIGRICKDCNIRVCRRHDTNISIYTWDFKKLGLSLVLLAIVGYIVIYMSSDSSPVEQIQESILKISDFGKIIRQLPLEY